jgi:two-component system, NarL family, nitrate/nitrite response regulator NarL
LGYVKRTANMTNLSIDPIRILVLDDQSMVRAGLRLYIEAQPGMEVVGEAGDLVEGLELTGHLRPDIILLDINLLEDLDFDIITRLIGTSSRARVILITRDYDSQVYLKALELGVMGLVTKTQRPEVLIKSIKKVHSGEVWIERSILGSQLSRLVRDHPAGEAASGTDHLAGLSNREKEVVELIGQGLKNKQIAEKLFISETTVRHHLTSIYSKLDVSDRLELLVYAHRHGLTKNSSQ